MRGSATQHLKFIGLSVVSWILLIGSPCLAQSNPNPKYWPLDKISFPIDVERVRNLNPQPVKLRFYAATTENQFDLISERQLNELEEIVDVNSRETKRGFNYTSRGNGTVDFALQYVFANGDASPITANLRSQYRIVFDTRQPVVRMVATARTTVEWIAEDENLGRDAIRLDVRFVGSQKWTPVPTREFGAKDRYTWNNLQPNESIEVRVVAKDLADHEGQSAIVRLPAASTDVNELRAPPGGSTGTGYGSVEDFNNRPQIEYLNNNKLTIRSKPTRITRSGITMANLWVKEQTGLWKLASTKDNLNITPGDVEKVIALDYTTDKDGLYSFLVQPVNGAGGKPEDPREGDLGQWLVEIDTIKPVVEIKSVRAVPGGLNGPRVEMEWSALDKNLMPEPITIEYSADPNGKTWVPIASKVANSKIYTWEVEDKNLWQFHVRISAIDKAGNVGTFVTKDPVSVDLEKPTAVIESIDKVGRSTPMNNPTPAPAPTPPMPQPTPPEKNKPGPGKNNSRQSKKPEDVTPPNVSPLPVSPSGGPGPLVPLPSLPPSSPPSIPGGVPTLPSIPG